MSPTQASIYLLHITRIFHLWPANCPPHSHRHLFFFFKSGITALVMKILSFLKRINSIILYGFSTRQYDHGTTFLRVVLISSNNSLWFSTRQYDHGTTFLRVVLISSKKNLREKDDLIHKFYFVFIWEFKFMISWRLF
jgi:hypothetical protein